MGKGEYERLKFYDKMMREIPNYSDRDKPMRCKDCAFYRPDWEHRFCFYSICKYGIVKDVFK